MKKLKLPLVHLCIWMSYVLFAVFYHSDGEFWITLYETCVSHLISAGIFYCNSLWILPKFLEQNRKRKFILCEIALFIISMGMRYGYLLLLDPILFGEPVLPFKFDYRLFTGFTWQWYSFILYSTGYWFALKSIRAVKRLREQDKIKLENAALRAQINPHFLFNTLNSFRIESAETLPKMSKDIGALIEVIRASISTTDDDGMIPLVKELNAIDSLVSIFKRRFPDMTLNYTSIIEDEEGYRILPHSLLTFVENALKHGDFDSSGKALTINITLVDGNLEFYVYNRKNFQLKDRSVGIGITYLRRHLQQGYGDRHKLIIEDRADDFEVRLNIKRIDRMKVTIKQNRAA